MTRPAAPDALVELRAVYARPGTPGDVETVARLLAALERRGAVREASAALVAFRACRGPCFRDQVRDRLDELAPPRPGVVRAARLWAAATLRRLRASGGR